jgi:nitroreductase
MDLLQALNWRYATKNMDPTKSVPEAKVQRILEAIRMTATSSGLQPYEIILVTNKDVRTKIQAAANNQAQITEGSHLLVFAAWNDYTAERINMMFDYNNEVRGFVNEGAEAYRQMLLKNYPAEGPEVNFQHAAKQSYIALGTALIAAAEQEVDATPMEGFNPKAVDEILDLASRGLRSTVLLPLGYREADKDWLVNMKKVRRTSENFITEIK